MPSGIPEYFTSLTSFNYMEVAAVASGTEGLCAKQLSSLIFNGRIDPFEGVCPKRLRLRGVFKTQFLITFLCNFGDMPRTLLPDFFRGDFSGSIYKLLHDIFLLLFPR